MTVTPITKDVIRDAMAAAEEAIAEDLRGMYPMSCRTLATTVQVLRDNLAWAEEEVIRKVAERMSSNVEFRGTAKRSFDGSPGTQG